MEDSDLIDKAGGTVAVARFCGVSSAVVTNWKARGIPTGWRKFLAVAKPDVFNAPPASPEVAERAAA